MLGWIDLEIKFWLSEITCTFDWGQGGYSSYDCSCSRYKNFKKNK